MLMRALLTTIAHETSGAARIRHSLRPLDFRGRENNLQTSGEMRRENATSCSVSSSRKRGPMRRVGDDSGSASYLECLVATTTGCGFGSPRSRRSVRGKNSRVATSACSNCVRSIRWHSRLRTSNLSHLNHLSPFPGHSCAKAGTQYSRDADDRTERPRRTGSPPARG